MKRFFYAIWERIATRWDSEIDRTSVKPLTRHEPLEKKLLHEFIARQAKSGPITVIEAGCGTGRLLLELVDLADKRRSFSNARYFLGVDLSVRMVTIAEARLNELLNKGSLKKPLWESNCRFVEGDMRKLLEWLVWFRRVVPLHQPYPKTVVICMFNTLGILSDKDINDALRAMIRTIMPQGSLLISVFRQDAFENWAERMYSHFPKLVGAIDEHSTFVSDPRTGANFDNWLPGGYRYHSHWFAPEDLERRFREAALELGLKKLDLRILPFGPIGLAAELHVRAASQS